MMKSYYNTDGTLMGLSIILCKLIWNTLPVGGIPLIASADLHGLERK